MKSKCVQQCSFGSTRRHLFCKFIVQSHHLVIASSVKALREHSGKHTALLSSAFTRLCKLHINPLVTDSRWWVLFLTLASPFLSYDLDDSFAFKLP